MQNIFVGFLVQRKTLKFAFETKRPLAPCGRFAEIGAPSAGGPVGQATGRQADGQA